MKTQGSPVPGVVALYCRVSTQEQVRNSESLGNQEAVLRQYCALRFPGRELVVYAEQGSARRTTRKLYKLMMREARWGRVAVIVATDLTRLWRNVMDALTEMNKIREWGGDVVLFRQGINTTTAAGKLQFAMIAAFGEYESNTISERTCRTHALHKSQGLRGPGLRPFGWSIEKDGHLKRIESEQSTADLVLAWRDRGRTWQACADGLNEAGQKTVLAKAWSPGGLRLVVVSLMRRRRYEAERLVGLV